MAGLSKEDNAEEFEKLDKSRVGVLVGSGMGGLQVFQDGVTNLVQKVRGAVADVIGMKPQMRCWHKHPQPCCCQMTASRTPSCT